MWMVKNFNSSGSINKGCLSKQGSGNAYKCFFGANVAPFVQTPLFVLNSKYDTWQGGAIIGANTTIDKLPAKVRAFWVNYGKQMVYVMRCYPVYSQFFGGWFGTHATPLCYAIGKPSFRI